MGKTFYLSYMAHMEHTKNNIQRETNNVRNEEMHSTHTHMHAPYTIKKRQEHQPLQRRERA